jgi:surfeit locus 1 family protein
VTTQEGAYRRSLLAPLAFTVSALLVLIGLGTWQLERKAWKEALIETVNARLAAPPMDLPAPAAWPRLDQADAEFRRVKLHADFRHDQEALVQATRSAFRSDVSGIGYWVFTPARVTDKLVLVNRGFVPESRRDAATRAEGQVSPLEITGVLRWPEARSWFTPSDDPGRNRFYSRDPAGIAAARGWDGVAPFYIEQEAPVPPGGLPHPSPLSVQLRNDHLQYAVTWYSLAAVLVVVFAVWIRGRRKPISPDERHVSAT